MLHFMVSYNSDDDFDDVKKKKKKKNNNNYNNDNNNNNNSTYAADDVAVVISNVFNCILPSFTVRCGIAAIVPPVAAIFMYNIAYKQYEPSQRYPPILSFFSSPFRLATHSGLWQ